MEPGVIDFGAYVLGDDLSELVVELKDDAGAAIDMTGTTDHKIVAVAEHPRLRFESAVTRSSNLLTYVPGAETAITAAMVARRSAIRLIAQCRWKDSLGNDQWSRERFRFTVEAAL